MIATIPLTRRRPPRKQRFREALLSPHQIKAERCRRSLFHFIQEFWPEVSADTPKWNWHIPYLAEELMQIARLVAEGKPKDHDLIINIPPGTTKSITATIMFPVWCWTNWYWLKFITASYSSALSLEHAEASRDLIRSEKFSLLFPHLTIKQDKDTKSNFSIQKLMKSRNHKYYQHKGGNRYSTSVGGTVTGFHAHIIIVDDPLDPNAAASEVELNKSNRWMEQTASTRKVDKEVTATILIQQRLHQDDTSGHMLNADKDSIKLISLPGQIRDYEGSLFPKDLRDKYVDDLLDPIRMNWPVLNQLKRRMGQYGYAGQIGQTPTPPGGGMFKVENFQIVDVLPPIGPAVRYWDNAATQGGGAYTVGTKMAKLFNSNKFVVMDVKRGQWDSDKRERIKKDTTIADGRGVHVWIEQEPGSSGKDVAKATIRNLAGYICKAECPTGKKEVRADPFSVAVNNGDVMLMRGEWNKDFIDEHEYYPFSTYKDQVDTSAGAYNRLTARKVARAR